jgi:hypothetical protein
MIISSSNMYELVAYRLSNTDNGYVTEPSSYYYNSFVYVYSDQSTVHSVAKLYATKSSNQAIIAVNSISLLSIEDGIQNSLLLDLTLKFAGSSQGYLELYLPAYSLANFGV